MVPIIIISHSKPAVTAYIKKLLKKIGASEALIKKIEKDGVSLKIDSIRSIVPFLIRATGEIRSVLIYDFETAKSEAQNALLKILEEKVDSTQFVIISKETSNILPTIISRAKVVRLLEHNIKKNHGLDEFEFGTFFGNTDKIKAEKALVIIDYLIDKMRHNMKDALVKKDTRQTLEKWEVLKECLNCRTLLMRNNLNPQMTVDHLLILSKFTTLA